MLPRHTHRDRGTHVTVTSFILLGVAISGCAGPNVPAINDPFAGSLGQLLGSTAFVDPQHDLRPLNEGTPAEFIDIVRLEVYEGTAGFGLELSFAVIPDQEKADYQCNLTQPDKPDVLAGAYVWSSRGRGVGPAGVRADFVGTTLRFQSDYSKLGDVTSVATINIFCSALQKAARVGGGDVASDNTGFVQWTWMEHHDGAPRLPVQGPFTVPGVVLSDACCDEHRRWTVSTVDQPPPPSTGPDLRNVHAWENSDTMFLRIGWDTASFDSEKTYFLATPDAPQKNGGLTVLPSYRYDFESNEARRQPEGWVIEFSRATDSVTFHIPKEQLEDRRDSSYVEVLVTSHQAKEAWVSTDSAGSFRYNTTDWPS